MVTVKAVHVKNKTNCLELLSCYINGPMNGVHTSVLSRQLLEEPGPPPQPQMFMTMQTTPGSATEMS